MKCSCLRLLMSVTYFESAICLILLLILFVLLWYHHNFIRDTALQLLSFKEEDCIDLLKRSEKLNQQFTGFQKRVHVLHSREDSLPQKPGLNADLEHKSSNEMELANRRKNHKGSLQQWWLFGVIALYWLLDSLILVYQMNFHATKTVRTQNSGSIVVKAAWSENYKVLNELATLKLYLLNHLHDTQYTFNNTALFSSLNNVKSDDPFDFTTVVLF